MYRSKWSSLVKQHVKQKGLTRCFLGSSLQNFIDVGATPKGTTVNSLR